MKKILKFRLKPALWLAAAILMMNVSCNDDEEIRTFKVRVKLEYPEGYAPAENISVTLRKVNAVNVDEAKTNADGIAEFTVIAGIYEAASSESRVVSGVISLLNGNKANIVVTDAWNSQDAVLMPVTRSEKKQLVIKELYVGGCRKDDGSGSFQRDPYMILYNNSELNFSADNLTFGTPFPSNAHATNQFMQNGELIYLNEDWMPASFGVWSIRGNLRIEPGKQIVIAMNSANDHTIQYSNSVNLANAGYYVAFDPESGYTHQLYHPSPSELIPTSHYLKGYRLPGVSSNGWTFSVSSPAFFVFIPQVSLDTYAFDLENIVYHRAPGTTGTTQAALKVNREWIIDGIEVFELNNGASQKRLTSDIDAGYVELYNQYGFTLYRNVDKAATEAIAENAGKIVYNYSLGTKDITIMVDGEQVVINGTTEPSGIDAEASIRNGARIVYKDTNNSSNDFHQRIKASLRD
jgi:hypothetical protein